MTATAVGVSVGGAFVAIVVILGVVFVKRRTLNCSPKGKKNLALRQRSREIIGI